MEDSLTILFTDLIIGGSKDTVLDAAIRSYGRNCETKPETEVFLLQNSKEQYWNKPQAIYEAEFWLRMGITNMA